MLNCLKTRLSIFFLLICFTGPLVAQPVDTATAPVKIIVLDLKKSLPRAGELVKMHGRKSQKDFTGVTDIKGETSIRALANDKYDIYIVHGTKDEHSSMLIIPPLNKGEQFTPLKLTLKTETPMFINLGNIEFEEGKAVLNRTAENDLQALADYMKRKASLVIEIDVESDSMPATPQMLKLQAQREEAIKQWLIKKGIKATRIRKLSDETMTTELPEGPGQRKQVRVRIY